MQIINTGARPELVDTFTALREGAGRVFDDETA
jgi:hypothetical protein